MQKLEQLILPFVLLSMLAIKAGNAIECYNCDSTIKSECSKITKSSTLKTVNCKPSVLGGNEVGDWLKEISKIDFFETGDVSVPMVCQKIIAKKEGNEIVTFRGCQLHGGKTDVCKTVIAKAEKNNIEIEHCSTCDDSDGCNESSSLRIINLWLLLAPLVIVKVFV